MGKRLYWIVEPSVVQMEAVCDGTETVENEWSQKQKVAKGEIVSNRTTDYPHGRITQVGMVTDNQCHAAGSVLRKGTPIYLAVSQEVIFI